MKVLVTGAAGNLGSVTCRVLLNAGIGVVAVDRRERTDLPVPVRVCDLLDRNAIYPFAAGVDAAIHLANHIDFDPPDPQKIFNENVAMNMNVFQAAADGGAKKLVFASSIQVIASTPRLPQYEDDAPAYLPADGASPPRPTNPYALSKLAGEGMLDYFQGVYGVATVAVRWPWLFHAKELPKIVIGWETKNPYLKQLLFSYLTFEDGAELIAAILRADLPGSRVYMPASRKNILGLPVRELLRRYYAGVPLRCDASKMDDLIDISDIERETGWKPLD